MSLPKKFLVLLLLVFVLKKIYTPVNIFAQQVCLRSNFGNTNCDFSGLINSDDLVLLFTDWIKSTSISDLRGVNDQSDQKVNAYDFGILSRNWGMGTPSSVPNITYESQYPWNNSEKAKLREIITHFHPLIVSLYGLPYKNTPLNLRRSSDTNPCSRMPCYYDHEIYFGYQSQGDITATIESDKSTVLHEYLHSFHGGKIMISSFEEPFAIAAGQILFPADEMYADWLNYQTYEYLKENQVLSYGHGVFGGFYSYISALELLKLQFYNPHLFIEVNSDNYLNNTVDTLSSLKKHSPSSIEGVSNGVWFANSFLYKSQNASYKNGLSIFLAPSNNSLMVNLAFDEAVPYEKPFAIKADFYDFNGNLLATQMKISGQNNELYDHVSFYLDQIFPNYHGKYKVQLRVTDPVTQAVLANLQREYYVPYKSGLSGVIRGANQGSLNISGTNYQKTISVNEGYFQIPELSNYKGELDLNFQNSTGQTVNKKILKVVPDYTTIITI